MAFCLSLRQAAPPTPVDIPADSNVEMTWQVFGGDAHEIYLALLKERCERDGNLVSEDACAGSDRSSELKNESPSPAQQVAGARRGAVRTDSELA
jgi:hypothetical protein